MNIIPIDRAVIGRDLDVIRQYFGVLVADMSWLVGQSITRWTTVVRKEGDEPVADPALALLMRVFDVAPHLNPIPQFPSAGEMYAYIRELRPQTTAKEFALMFGAEGTAGYRWQRMGQRVGSNSARLMYYVKKLLDGSKNPAADLENYIKMVKTEGRVRGVEDLFGAGRWNTEETEGSKKKKAMAEAKEAVLATPGSPPAKKVAAKK